jgi:UDP-N-acetylmuramate--alanine ligase
VAGARAIVFTAAVPSEHPELAAARAAGIPVVRRADALQALVGSGEVVAVAGTHGKTTTTVMTTEALAAAGRHPTGIAGGRVATWGGNARVDGDTVFVVEADEYDKSFLALKPAVALVNNVEVDHLECYDGSVAALEGAFGEFAGRARLALFGADDAGATRVARQVRGQKWLVGTAGNADLRITELTRDRLGSRALLRLPGGGTAELRLQVPGLHNVRNAAMAVGATLAVGADVSKAEEALATFTGVGRRFEPVGSAKGVTIVDDYAHHPSEVAATIAAARQRFPGARLVAVFQPHLYSRTRLLGEALGVALAAADRVVVTDVYAAREAPIAGVSGRLVADAARRAGASVEWVADRGSLANLLAQTVGAGDVVLTLGAGDITGVGRELLERLTGAAA